MRTTVEATRTQWGASGIKLSQIARRRQSIRLDPTLGKAYYTRKCLLEQGRRQKGYFRLLRRYPIGTELPPDAYYVRASGLQGWRTNGIKPPPNFSDVIRLNPRDARSTHTPWRCIRQKGRLKGQGNSGL